MNVTILFFGMLAEETQTSRLEINTDSVNITGLKTEILNLFPGLRKFSFGIALNETIISGDTKLTPQSRVAFLPPFAGG